jgi:hypothetical protein
MHETCRNPRVWGLSRLAHDKILWAKHQNLPEQFIDQTDYLRGKRSGESSKMLNSRFKKYLSEYLFLHSKLSKKEENPQVITKNWFWEFLIILRILRIKQPQEIHVKNKKNNKKIGMTIGIQRAWMGVRMRELGKMAGMGWMLGMRKNHSHRWLPGTHPWFADIGAAYDVPPRPFTKGWFVKNLHGAPSAQAPHEDAGVGAEKVGVDL